MTAAERLAILRRFADLGKTVEYAARKLETSVPKVRGICERHGIELGARVFKPKAQRKAEVAATGRPAGFSPMDQRLNIVRATNRRRRLPEGFVRADGPYSGDCEVVGPPGEDRYDFDKWLAWSRQPATQEAAQKERAA